ncbi:MAG: ATP-binding protein [Lachnospiraceae bacterium]|nr:ATP-binding protein [Lachnospiraceae bacterium]
MDGWKINRSELNRFQDIGLIAPTDDFTHNNDIASFYSDDNRRLFLSTYLQTFKDTTKPLKDIYERMRLFKDILDERNAITGKIAKYSKDGIALYVKDRKIELETLSSGEKHDFIMFYNLIFNTRSGGLVLIDEPEISLHIEWQNTYLDMLFSLPHSVPGILQRKAYHQYQDDSPPDCSDTS